MPTGNKRTSSAISPEASGGDFKRLAVTNEPIYSHQTDFTLTKSQKTTGKISRPNDFRAVSNPTESGYSSGYHESVMTTGIYNFFSRAVSNGNGTHTLPSTSERTGLSGYTGKRVDSEILKMSLSIADGYRTDTAQTILSGPNGTVGAHSGSDLTLTGVQGEAHQLLRDKVIEIAQLPKKEQRGLTKKSLSVIYGSVTVSSMAPGEKARGIETNSLKAGAKGKNNWEVNRNESKLRVRTVFDSMTSDEQAFALKHSESFLDSTGDRARSLDNGRPNSPLRQRQGRSNIDQVDGGRYLSLQEQTISIPTKKPPTEVADLGLYFTEPFRTSRTSSLTIE
ncbi:MAG: hypothetical protein WA160_12240 [Pseudobdellovibrio sp.]